ncbi:MAG: helicase-exonuclease AddAB subunit AddA [Eubacterium sp.]|nr:helicase-exonuclease AddAB subunit AddA [Eubacterium sp.]
MINWTSSQLNAINVKNSNILVSAAAGSGKTAVLVERVIKLICDENNPVDLDKLLIVTFTNAAAAEMKGRISERLNSYLLEHPNDTNVRRQLSLVPVANISTIDSFCINLVREYFFKLDISRDFSILDNSEQLLLEEVVLQSIIEEKYEDANESFKDLVELLSTTKNDNNLIACVKRINNYISAQAFPFEWLDSVCEIYNPEVDFVKTKVYRTIAFEINEAIGYAKELLNNSSSNLDEYDSMYDSYSAMINEDGDIFKRVGALLNEKKWNELKEYVNNIKFDNAPRAKKDANAEIKTIVLNNRAIYKDIINKDIKGLVSADIEEIKADNEYLYPRIKELISLVKEFNSVLLEAKKELNSYSFSDIEHFAIELLFYNENREIIRTELAKEYENTFYEILVDEYQDTNSAQDTLFKMLSNGHNRFMVGDIKQSIYRFRLAMPEIFLNKKHTYQPYDKASPEKRKQIMLDTNYRSREGICDYTNFVFSKLMSESAGGVDYTKEEYLYNGANYPYNSAPCAQLKLVNTPEDEDIDEYEAKEVASLILDKIKNKEQVRVSETETRNIEFGDFAILFRSSKNRLPVFSKVFSEFGIPVIANNRTNLFENNEVSILISLLRVVDNPIQDVPLLATLMSVFYGYTADEIASARVNHRNDKLYFAIIENDIFKKFNEDIERYRKYACSMSIESFIRLIIDETSYLSLISAMGNDEQRKLNVMKFVELAKSFDAGENVGLTAFMRYIDNIISSGYEIESAEVNANGENAVNLMSIHKSKGLEFPVVILAGSAHQYNKDDLRQLVLLNNELGIGLKVNNEEKLYRYNSIQYSGIKALNSRDLMSENLRVLYVAITRAKEQFITFASYKNINDKIDKLSGKIIDGRISPYVVKKASSDAELLIMTALLHKDADVLRDCCAVNIPSDTDFCFDLSVDIIGDKFEKKESAIETVNADEELVNRIKEKLSFEYKRTELSSYSSKLNASSLDKREQSYKFFASKKPSFISDGKLTGAEKGTAMHEFMQYCDYNNAKVDLEGEIKRIYDEGYLSEIQCASLNREKLKAFFNSALAKRMFKSKNLYREFKISSFVPISELEESEFNDRVLIQGIADCVFEEDGELVLVDYKTDYVKDEKELLNLYKNQINFYKNAVSKTLNMRVKEAMLYSFSLSKECIY